MAAPDDLVVLWGSLAQAVLEGLRTPEADVTSNVTLPPACVWGEALSGDCPVCLEELRPGQPCCRTPCLHVFHKACLRNWVQRSASCPVCKLDLTGPSRDLRIPLEALDSFHDKELEYMNKYLGITAPGAKRSDLEFALLSSSRVRVLCKSNELRNLADNRLQALLEHAGGSASLDTPQLGVATGGRSHAEDCLAAGTERHSSSGAHRSSPY